MDISAVITLVCFIVVVQIVGGIGALFTARAIPAWYARLRKPKFTPPNRVFGPVWTALYLLMGIASFLVWTSGAGPNGIRLAEIVFGIQLAANMIWSIVFFGWRNPLAAFGIIIFLWFMIATTVVAFWMVDPLAAILMIPYLLWTSFAAYLNFGVAWLNGKTAKP
jgi:tryptophan-rich sensory protein